MINKLISQNVKESGSMNVQKHYIHFGDVQMKKKEKKKKQKEQDFSLSATKMIVNKMLKDKSKLR